MSESNLQANRNGYVGIQQRRRLLFRVFIRFVAPIVLLVIIIVIPPGKSQTVVSVTHGQSNVHDSSHDFQDFLVAFLIIELIVWNPLQAFKLLQDVRSKVVEDCGTLTYVVYSGRRGYALIWIDNNRSYLWNKQIEGGFLDGEIGCAYFLQRTKMVLTIETFDKDILLES